MKLNLITAAIQAGANLPAVKISLVLFAIAGVLLTIAFLSKSGFWYRIGKRD